MSAMDISKDKEQLKRIKDRKDGKIKPLSSKDKSYFSKIRIAIKRKK